MTNDLTGLLSALQRFELPVLTKDSFKVGAARLSDLPAEITNAGDVCGNNAFRILDYYVTELLPARFDPRLAFHWAGGPDDGRTIRLHPAEEDFESEDELDQAIQDYWVHFGEPEPWQELACPIRTPGDNRGPRELRPISVRAFLLERVRWTINNKRYCIPRGRDKTEYVSFSMNPIEQATIRAQEAENQQQRANLIDLFVEGLSDPYRFFHTNHVLDERSVGARGWSMQRDEIFAIIDPVHLRVLWTLRDREYG